MKLIEEIDRLRKRKHLRYLFGVVAGISYTIFLMIYAVVAVGEFKPLGFLLVGLVGALATIAGVFGTSWLIGRSEKRNRERRP